MVLRDIEAGADMVQEMGLHGADAKRLHLILEDYETKRSRRDRTLRREIVPAAITPYAMVFDTQSVAARKEIRDQVEDCRVALFGRREAPFATMEKALEWITPQVDEAGSVIGTLDEVEATRRQVGHLQARKVPGQRFSFSQKLLYVPWPKAPNGVGYHASSQELDYLAATSLRLARATGWEGHQAVEHILTGKIPLVRPLSVRRTTTFSELDGGTVERTYLTVSVRSSKFGSEAWSQLEEVIRDHFGDRQFSPGDGEFWTFLTDYARKHGWPPSGKGVRPYWRAFIKDWNSYVEKQASRPGVKPYKEGPDDGSGARKRYERIRKKLVSLGMPVRPPDSA